jgi:sterol desaturase/sphingolipid hydroxylase (fatty acid hydroxylase superfamily)
VTYYWWLFGISILALLLELLWPARKQRQLREWLWSDVVHLLFNGHFLGVWIYGIATYHVLPYVDAALVEQALFEVVYRQFFAPFSLWIQIPLALLTIDFIHWCVHNLLHRSSWLWRIHQVHHSVKDGEMDWIVAFRFSWLEPVIYKTLTFLPAAWFGFAPEAIFTHAVFGTLIGHLNHANLSWDYGIFRYLLNSPRMHLHHHAYEVVGKGQNFGIIFSCWDWLFGTAILPEAPPEKLGFQGVEEVPEDFFGQLVWPIPQLGGVPSGTSWKASLLGTAVLMMLYLLSLP